MPEPVTAPLDPKVPVRVIFLGGLGEIGRNCMVIEQGAADDPDRTMMLIDCGLMFPDAHHHGIDLILPDFTYLKENAERISAIVLTHGHEDHIGAIQYLMRDGDGIGGLRKEKLPVYGSALALGLAKNRIEEAGLMPKIDMRPVQDGQQIDVGSLLVEFIPVTHSVPHAHAVAVHTAQGVVLHSGDFKIDLTPVDERRADLARIGQLAKNEGIRLLMSDSTNAEEPGYASSETKVGGVLRGLFAQQRGRRIITASFASHLHRIQQIADAAVGEGRKVATLGLSMKKNIRLGLDLGVFKIPESSLIDIEEANKYDDGEICIISTGSQGEPMSALGLMARGENRWMKLTDNDTVVLSSHAIPGNEGSVNKVIDGLLRLGAQVVHSGIMDVHATGHAKADDIKTYLSIVNPEWFVPIHGEYRHMVANAKLGELMGVAGEPDHPVRGRRRARTHHRRARPRRPRSCRLPLRRRHRRRRRQRCAARPPQARRGGCGRRGVDGRHADRQGAGAARDHHPRLGLRTRGRGPARRSVRHGGGRVGEGAGRRRARRGALEKEARKATGKFVSDRTKRRPMIVPVVMEA